MQNITDCKEKLTVKKYQYGIALGILICLAVLAMAMMVHRSTQATSSFPIPVNFTGEYSQNGGDWQPLTPDTKINALNGDLVLRGHFDLELNEVPLNAYLDNISITVLVDGEEEFSVLNPDPIAQNTTGAQWINWTSHALTAKKVEIHLSNAHTVGNPNAYTDFLSKLYVGDGKTFENYILSPGNFLSRNIEFEGAAIWVWFLQSGQFWRSIGFCIFVISLILFGVALADSLQSKLFGRKLWLLGTLSVFSVGVIVLDTPDVSLWHFNMAFNTYGAQLCRMLWMLTLSLFSAQLLTGRRRQAACAAALFGGLFDAGVFLLFLLGNTYIVNIMTPWFWLQAVICLTLTISCSLEIKHMTGRKKKGLLAALLLILWAVAAELCNGYFGFWQRGILLHSVFVLLLLIYGILAVKRVPTAYHATKEAEALKEELMQNRISIMLSQIQPHFLYNSLNTIQYLCKTQPEEASRAIGRFSKYLRANMDSLDQIEPVPLEQDIEHLKNYLSIEKLRFPDIEIDYELQCTDFCVPALTLQPLVENAIKHGVRQMPSGGIIGISSWEDENAWYLCVEDNGGGFDTKAEPVADEHSHVGLKNTRSRLQAMCGGSLMVKSAPGCGAEVTITIPKEEAV